MLKLIIFLLGFISFYGHAALDVQPIENSRNPWRQVQDAVDDAVVLISVYSSEYDFFQPYRLPRERSCRGSGFFIDQEGHIITNAHVVDCAITVEIQISSFGKKKFRADLISIAPERDLALLKLREADLDYIRQSKGELTVLPLGDSSVIQRSDEALALGYPLGQESLKSTSGVISSPHQLLMFEDRPVYMIQTSSPINPGNSGGPLINAKGEVIGINSGLIKNAQNIGYAVPVNELKAVLPEFFKRTIVRGPYLPADIQCGSDDLARYLNNPLPSGCYITEVFKGSPLEQGGIQTGDMIYEIDGHAVDQYGQITIASSKEKITLMDYCSTLPVGRDVSLVIYRNGERKEITVRNEYLEAPAVDTLYPSIESMDYEIFAGMVVMKLTKNHFHHSNLKDIPRLKCFNHRSVHEQPILMVTYTFPDAELFTGNTIISGSTINQVNGVPVKTLDEFRQAIKDAMKDEVLVICSSNNSTGLSDHNLTVLPWKKIIEQEPKLARTYGYTITPLAQELIDTYNASHAQQAMA